MTLIRDKREVARLFNLLEDRRPEKFGEAAARLDELFRESMARGHVIGITGPPGAGKSTLTSRIIQHYRGGGKSISVLAVDPSSRKTSGALLGDRIRFEYDPADLSIFVRSMASRGDYGGLSDRAFAGMIVLRSAFDIVLVETVGVGQGEADIFELVDTTMLIIQPGSGDTLQFLKAGIMELPQILVVNKSDMGEPARRSYLDLKAALGSMETEEEWNPRVLLCSAQTGDGIAEVCGEIDRHFEFLQSAGLTELRRKQAESWIRQAVRFLYGTRGVERLNGMAEAEGLKSSGPFDSLEAWIRKLEK